MSKYPEDILQMQVAAYLDLLKVLWFHPANERRTSPQAGARLKKKGVKSGVPDVIILKPNNAYNGLAIELKVKPNKTTTNQKQWLKSLVNANWKTGVCFTFDEAKLLIDEYLKTQ